MSARVLLKLGGSVITRKEGACSPHTARLQEIASVISQYRTGLILVHGAGSCGHPEAKAYGIAEGANAKNRAGVQVTHAAVRALNDTVVAALRDHGTEAVGVHPLCAATADNKRILSFDPQPIGLLCDLGIVPVLHGDVVMDRTRGACIVSGDQIVSWLATAMGIRRVGLATDVAGVLEKSRVVDRLGPEKARTVRIGTSSHTDVTGGMQEKVRELLALAQQGTESHIFHVSRLADFLDNRDHGGTIICREG